MWNYSSWLAQRLQQLTKLAGWLTLCWIERIYVRVLQILGYHLGTAVWAGVWSVGSVQSSCSSSLTVCLSLYHPLCRRWSLLVCAVPWLFSSSSSSSSRRQYNRTAVSLPLPVFFFHPPLHPVLHQVARQRKNWWSLHMDTKTFNPQMFNSSI